MALTEFYVDPSIAGDSGTGIISDPYGDLEFCLSDATHPSSDGARINIKAGTNEVLVAAMDVVTAYSNTNAITRASPLVFQGYTSAAGDGGQGGIGGGGSVAVFAAATNFVSFVDLHCLDSGSVLLMSTGAEALIINCDFEDSTNATPVNVSTGKVIGCYFHNFTASGRMLLSSGAHVLYNRFIDEGTNQLTGGAIRAGTANISVIGNIIWLDGTGLFGIRYGQANHIEQNGVFNNTAGTGDGIEPLAETTRSGSTVMNNNVEGFSGSGGVGIREMTTDLTGWFAGNAVFNCTTPYDIDRTHIRRDADDNETLSASPFTDAANKDFTPVDTGNVKEGSKPEKVGNFA